jgi:hypothetical protein
MAQKLANLDHCWVCSARFTDCFPPGPANREEHHIIPRQAGGTDGPVVSLCDGHHTMLHKIAMRLSSGKPHFDLVTGETDDRKKKIYWLATRVYNAFQAVSGDPNKKVMVLLELDRDQQERIAKLRKVYPKVTSREELFDLAIRSLYSKHFT